MTRPGLLLALLLLVFVRGVIGTAISSAGSILSSPRTHISAWDLVYALSLRGTGDLLSLNELQGNSTARRSFSVKNYGAKGDGTTDDTLSIQAAITAAQVNGGEIFVPTGKYFLSSGLMISSTKGVWLRGNGFSSQLFFENAKGIATGLAVSSASNVEISDLRVTGADISTLSRGIYISSSSNVRVHNVWQSGATFIPVVGPLAGIGTTTSLDISVTECDVSGNGYDVGPDVFNSGYDIVQYSGAAARVHFRNNRVHDSKAAFSIAIIDANDSDIVGNYVDQNNKLGTNHGGSGYGLLAYGGRGIISNIQISLNTVKNTAGDGIYLAAVDTATVKANVLDKVAQQQTIVSLPVAGIALNGVNHGAVTGGSVIASNKAGIEVSNGTFNTITGVTIKSPVADGIKLNGSSDITVGGNTIENAGGQGIYAPVGGSVRKAKILYNVIKSAVGQGIYLDLAGDSTIANNTIDSPGAKGILVTNTSTAHLIVKENTIKGVTANQTGIAIYGSNHIVSRNVVAAASNTNSIGIDTNNPTSDSIISENTVSGFAVGIYGIGGRRNEISHNIVSNNTTPLNTSATTRVFGNQ
jgi:parallel beta-helix repeat protein